MTNSTLRALFGVYGMLLKAGWGENRGEAIESTPEGTGGSIQKVFVNGVWVFAESEHEESVDDMLSRFSEDPGEESSQAPLASSRPIGPRP